MYDYSNPSSVFGFCFMLIELLRLCFWSKAFYKYYVIFVVGHHLSNSIQVALNHMEILWRLVKTYDLAKRDLSHQESVIIGLYLLDSNVPCKMSHHKGLVQVSPVLVTVNFIEKEVLVLQFSHALKAHWVFPEQF